MKEINISDDIVEKYTLAAHKYIQSTMNWKLNEYRLKFHYVETKKQVAVFSAIHNQGLFEIYQQAAKKHAIHPLEISILVDIVDLSVQENTPDAKFLHEIK
jgi:hypothetical protein